MKINQKTLIVGKKVVLLPYESHHVPKYHEWMKSEELQQLTASEPLSLEEEFSMQKSWREDENKCTFIVAEKSRHQTEQGAGQVDQKQVEIESMVGDVNLFFMEEGQQAAEVEIMIAEKRARGHGLGKEALCSMMRYGADVLGVRKFVAKIGLQNLPSIRLFMTLGFTETSRSDVFQETTMEVDVSGNFMQLLQSLTPEYAVQTYGLSG